MILPSCPPPTGSSTIRSPSAFIRARFSVVEHVRQWGQAVILSDGDAVFQPRKIARSGLWDAFAGNVLIYVHKENELADVERWHPAAHYVLVDDKARILAAVKAIWGDSGYDRLPEAGPLRRAGAAARRGVRRSRRRQDRRSAGPRSVETAVVSCGATDLRDEIFVELRVSDFDPIYFPAVIPVCDAAGAVAASMRGAPSAAADTGQVSAVRLAKRKAAPG